MTCTSVFKLMPRKGEYIFKVVFFGVFIVLLLFLL